MNITKKFCDTYHVESIVNFIFFSNSFAPVKIEDGDRRFFVSEVSGDVLGKFQYFKALYATFTDEFYENLLAYFMNRDVSWWEPSEIPMSQKDDNYRILTANNEPIHQGFHRAVHQENNSLKCLPTVQGVVKGQLS